MKILMIGDIVGTVGMRILEEYLPELKRAYQPDVIVANGENAAVNGRGIGLKEVRELIGLGVDCITLGNHAWAQPEIFDFIDQEERLIRPANYPEGTPGRGWVTLTTTQGKCTIINLMGRTFFADVLDCPFRTVEHILENLPPHQWILVDFHAETTSEKQALGWFLDGKVSAVAGTHTHVQTADERILPKGTGYITDVGMVGAYDGIIGMDKEMVIKRFRTQLPVRFAVAKEGFQFHGVLFELDEESKMTKKIQRIQIGPDRFWIT